MKKLVYILIFFGLTASCQGFDMTEHFNRFFQGDGTVELGFSVGNSCDDPRYMNVHHYGDMDMNNQTLQVMHSHIIVHGELFNEGTIEYHCDSSIFEVLGGTLSIPNNDIAWLKIWPNPATSEVNITGAQVWKLQMFDIFGRELKVYETFGSQHRIMLDGMASGIYIIRVNGEHNYKLVIE